MTTIVIFNGDRREFENNTQAAASIRDYEAGHENQSDAEVINNVQISAKRSADRGERAEIMVTHLP